MKDGEATDPEEVGVVVPRCGGHAREGVEPAREKDERGRAGGSRWGTRGEKGDTTLGERLEDDLPSGFVFEGGINELCCIQGQTS